MSKKLVDLVSRIKKEVKSHPIIYLMLSLILLIAIFVRIYNVTKILGFYYDQGRDALVIWDFWKNGDIFLLGPTTGIEGVFRGPWYYWLITPAYVLGGGNPIFPAVFLSLTSVVAIFFLYLTGKEIMNREAGIIAAVIGSVSYYVVVHSRWLSNPTPMLLVSTMLIWAYIKAYQKYKWAWVLIAFLLGMALQFGSAAEIFYFPTFLFFVFRERKQLPSRKILLISFFVFFITFIPQIIFDILKHGVLSSAIQKFLIGEGSFKLSFWDVVRARFQQYYFVFTSIIHPGERVYILVYFYFGLGVIFANLKKFLTNKNFVLLTFFLLSPIFGMLFFQGNYGNVFDYYFSGYYFPFILLFCLPLGFAAKNWGGKIMAVIFIVIALKVNIPLLESYTNLGRSHFTYEDQRNAVRWVYEDAKERNFNVDIYVPPVIPYAYDYLFKWYGDTIGKTPDSNQVELLYTLFEQDPPSPDRLERWLDRQSRIGRVEEKIQFGGITVERRTRI